MDSVWADTFDGVILGVVVQLLNIQNSQDLGQVRTQMFEDRRNLTNWGKGEGRDTSRDGLEA